ncbi:hypothetical protein PEC18_27140 [Paucibacter sp. O1-1]|nr:hypothetical protein [Paucibacter sp. O1-1]MDA3829418.1 hypothetical protein [Paucibacter sp. O1-1]
MDTNTDPASSKRRVLLIALTFIGLLLLCVVNAWVFQRVFARSYLGWYASAGPIIAIATAAFGAAWGGLDKNPALVSANPLSYLGACLQIAGLPLVASGAHLRSANRRSPIGFEVLPLLILALALSLAIIGWLLLIVPAQYFLFLVAGAFSRAALSSSAQVRARLRSGQVDISEDKGADAAGPGADWWDASMRSKPVTLASAYGAAILFLLGLVLPV